MAAMAYLLAGHGGPVPTGSSAGYLPIEEHGIVGDLRTVTLVGTDGTVDWYCPSRFDAPSLFGALLDARKGGYFSLRSRSSGWPKQLYLPDTNILGELRGYGTRGAAGLRRAAGARLPRRHRGGAAGGTSAVSIDRRTRQFAEPAGNLDRLRQ